MSPEWLEFIDSLPLTATATTATSALPACDLLALALHWAQHTTQALGKRWTATDSERASTVFLGRCMLLLNAYRLRSSVCSLLHVCLLLIRRTV